MFEELAGFRRSLEEAGRYTIERELGHGGMAIVLLAHDVRNDRKVAVKVLRPELAAALGAERFLREIAIAAQLRHPNILPLFDSGKAADSLYYVMPYVEGESLRARLQRETQLPLDEALRITREVADALSYAHSRDVVHRDIKPENILLDSGHAIVADFGIARALTVAGGEALTQTGITVGTPAYMSPEQASGEHRVDGRSDVYSLGCMLYELLAGEPPYTGPTAQAIFAKRLSEPVPRLRVVRETVPEGVEQAIGKALSKVPADRFSTPIQLAEALTLAAGGRPRIPLRRVVAGVSGVVALIAGMLIVKRPRATVPVTATRIAVLPLAPSGPDTGLVRLGRDLVVTLSANLDGVGDIKVVDAGAILNQTAGRATLTLADAAALARRFGAKSVVSGGLVRMGPSVRIELGLFDTGDLSSLAHATVVAAPYDYGAITDSLSRAILGQIWRHGSVPTPSLEVALKTRSLPALRAFLEGEQLLVQGQFDSAAAAYRRAFETDTAFWLACFRYAYVFNWTEQSGADSMSEVAWQHRSALPERERALLEIAREDSFAVEIPLTREFVERYPDYWPGWFQYGDDLFHWGGPLGYTRDDAIAALERTVTLNPNVFFAWEHLFEAALAHDNDKAGRALAEMARLGGGSYRLEGLEFDNLPGYRLLLQVAETYPTFDTKLLDSVARGVAAAKDAPSWQVRAGLSIYGFPRAQIELSRRILRIGLDQGRSTAERFFIARAWITRGAWDSALAQLDAAVAAAPRESRAFHVFKSYELAVYGVWLGAVDAGRALYWRNAVTRALDRDQGSLEGEERAFLAWLDGVLAAAREDRAALSTARRQLRGDTLSFARWLDGSLAAFDLGLAGAYRRAADSVITLAREPGRSGEMGRVGSVNLLAGSGWLLALGDTATAADLLSNFEDYFGPQHIIFDGPMFLERARIEAALGRSEDARHDYENFLQRYDLPAPAHRHLIGEAKEALSRLTDHTERRTTP